MLATDPLSLVFVSCIVFSGTFLVISSVLGLGHGHGLHVGHAGHALHIGHAGHVGQVAHAGQAGPAGPAAHAAHSMTAHGAAHGNAHAPSHAQPDTAYGDATAPVPVSPWQSVSTALLGALNLYGLLMFLFVFGLLGYLLHNAAHAGALLAVLLPLVFGAAAAVGTGVLLRQLFESDAAGELTTENSQIEGQLGTVSMAIRAGGIGEVVFTSSDRGRQSVSARSADGEAIPAGTQIVILSYEQGVARVQSWDRFLAGARASSQLSSAPPGETGA